MHVEDNGWDCQVALSGSWLWRGPRRPEVAERLRLEAMLLPWLAPRLPVAVPRPEIRTEEPLRVRHEVLPGEPCGAVSRAEGEQLGRFLAALHAVDVDEAIQHGARPAEVVTAEKARDHDRFASEVVRLLPSHVRAQALALLMRLVQTEAPTVVVHGDLGPDHVRVVDGTLTGVIDWLDAGVHDPAIDLAWPLHVASTEFAAGVRATYDVDADVEARARDLALRAPLYDVLHGIDTGDRTYVDAGVRGFVTRCGG